MTDSTDSGQSEMDTSQTRTKLIHALLIDAFTRTIVDVYMTPSYHEVVKLIGSSFFVPHRFGALRGDTLYCDEGTFPIAYTDFSIGDCHVTGSGLVVGRTLDHVLVDCELELGDLAKLVTWNEKVRRT